MELKKYLKKRGDAKKFADTLEIHAVYLNSLVHHRRTPSRKLAAKIELKTGGAVTAMELLYPKQTGRGEKSTA